MTLQVAKFLLAGILAYMPLTSATFSIEQADWSLFDDVAFAPTPPSFVVAKTNNLMDEWGEAHGEAIVLYSELNASETYMIKEYLKAQHSMEVMHARWPCPCEACTCEAVANVFLFCLQRGKWYWDGALIQTWMAWPSTNWTMDEAANHLKTYLVDNFGWAVGIEDWTNAEEAVHAMWAPHNNNDE